MRQRQPLTSPSNPRVRAAAALRQRRERDRTGLYLVEGPHGVRDALAVAAVEEVFATEAAARELGAASPDRMTLVSEPALRAIADSVTPQGIVAIARQRRASLDDVAGSALLVVLDEIADPGNAGTIIRTADHQGASGVVFSPGSVDPWNPKTVRAAAGSHVRVPLVVAVTAGDAVAAHRAAGGRAVALVAHGGVALSAPGVLAAPLALAFGSEAHGLSEAVLAACDAVVTISGRGGAESLNLAAAVAVAVHAAAAAHAAGITVEPPVPSER